MQHLLDPAVLFFLLGILAGVFRSDLKIPQPLYETLSLYLLIAIGLKGGLALQKTPAAEGLFPLAAALALGVAIPVIAYTALRRLAAFSNADAAALAAHYGSVSAVTFAVVLGTLQKAGVGYEGFVTVLLVVMEVPAIMVAIVLVRVFGEKSGPASWKKLFHELFFGKSIFLMLGAMAIGFLTSDVHAEPLRKVFVDPFKGVLALFLLEMGLVTARRMKDLRAAGPRLAVFAVLMPLVSGFLGAWAGALSGLSLGGCVVLSTLAASSSYIAAPAAVRVAIPQANPAYYLTASLGVTFPFNLTIGIPVYVYFSNLVFSWMR